MRSNKPNTELGISVLKYRVVQDEGGYQADLDFVADKTGRMSDKDYDKLIEFCEEFDSLEPDEQISVLNQFEILKQRRCNRLKREDNLKGKYLIVCIGVKSKKTVYLQDRKISKGGFWTQYKSNALGFDTKTGAEKVAKKFKYNNPVVVLN